MNPFASPTDRVSPRRQDRPDDQDRGRAILADGNVHGSRAAAGRCRYKLQLRVGNQGYWSWIVPEAPVEAMPLENTGTTCLVGGWEHGWQARLGDGSWQAVEPSPPGRPVPAIAVITPPGQELSARRLRMA
jgi:hypothetical protein